MTNLYRHPFHGHLRAADTAPADYVEVSLAALGTSPSTVAPLYRTLETTTPTIWHPQRYYSGAPEQEGFQDGYSNAIIYAYKRSATVPTDDPGDITYSFATASIVTASLANGWYKSIGDTTGNFSLYVISISAASQDATANYLAADWGVPTLLAQSATDSVTVLLSNPTHAIPTDNAGNNGNYIGSGTEVRVYEGSTELAYNGTGATAGTWNATLVGTGITAGSKTDSGNYLTIGNHSAIVTDVASVAITVTGKRIDGTSFTIPAVLQSLSKSKAGADGVGGPTVSITSSRPTTFTYTDGIYDSGQSNITLTGIVNNLASPTLAWTFQGFEVNPVDSTTATQVITSAQLGVMRSAKVTLTANGTYVDTITIVRLDKSTAVAGATRNVFRGTWASGTSYTIGDIVLDANGYGWSCLTAHTSSGGVTTPVYPVTSNTNWTIYTVKGDSSTSGFLTNETHTVPTAADGTGASYTSAGGTFKVSYGTLDVTTSSTFAITGGTDGGTTWSKTQNGLTLTLNETTGVYTLAGAAWTSDSETFTLTATYASTVISKIYSISKAKGGAAGTPAQYVTISGEQAFKFPADAVVPTVTSITLTATLFGGLTLYSWQYWNSSSWVNLSGTQNTSSYALAYNNAAWTTSSLRVRCLSGSVWDEYTVVKLFDGATGPQGATGATGAAGPQGPATYTWIAYADNSTGTLNFTIGDNTGQTYIGIANNKSTNVEGTNPADYTWSKIQGSQGVPGTPGPDGQPTYTWFAYANSADGTVGFTTGAWINQAYLGLAANKLTTTESTNPADYFWSKIQGDVGPQGPSGSTGATGQSARSAYIVTTSAAAPTATAGSGDVVPTNIPAGTVAGKGWNFTAYSTLATGEFQYRIDGLYTPGGNIAWGNAYLNYLKVGTLEALSTNTGSLTVSGTLTTGNPVRNGTTMTSGKGILQESNGAFIMGTPATNIAFDGTNPIKVNGEIVFTENLAPMCTTYILHDANDIGAVTAGSTYYFHGSPYLSFLPANERYDTLVYITLPVPYHSTNGRTIVAELGLSNNNGATWDWLGSVGHLNFIRRGKLVSASSTLASEGAYDTQPIIFYISANYINSLIGTGDIKFEIKILPNHSFTLGKCEVTFFRYRR